MSRFIKICVITTCIFENVNMVNYIFVQKSNYIFEEYENKKSILL